MWADHLRIAHYCPYAAEHDLAKAISTMGAALLVLQRDLSCESLRVESAQDIVQSV